MGRFAESKGALKREFNATKKHNVAVKRQQVRNAGYTQLARLLPGDQIHFVAPVNRELPFSFDRDVTIAEAELKRQRKLAKRSKLIKT